MLERRTKMINDLLNGSTSNNIVNIKFTENNQWHSFIFKCACINSKKILSEQEFKKAQVRKGIVELFEMAYNAFATKNKEEYTKIENFIDTINVKFDELKGESVPTVEKVEEEQQVNTLEDIQINKQEIITEKEDDISIDIQEEFKKQVVIKKLPKELQRLKKDNK